MKTLKSLLMSISLLILFCLSENSSFSQTTCNTATVVQMDYQNTYQISGNEYWFSFTATSEKVYIQATPSGNPAADINSIELYDGSCQNLNLLSQNDNDSLLNIYYRNLCLNNSYFIKITRLNTDGYFDFVISKSTVIIYDDNDCLPVEPCNLISNGNFEIFFPPAAKDTTDTITDIQNPLYVNSFGVADDSILMVDTVMKKYSNMVCGWENLSHTPNIKPSYCQNDYAAFMWGFRDKQEGIKTNVRIYSNIDYYISYIYKMISPGIILPEIRFGFFYSTIDNLNFISNPSTNQSFNNFINTIDSSNFNIWKIVEDTFSLGTLMGYSKFESLVIYPFVDNESDSFAQFFIDDIVIKPLNAPQAPIVDGPKSICLTGKQIYTFTITNYDSLYPYYYATDSSDYVKIDSSSFQINLSNVPDKFKIIVKVCDEVTEIFVHKCCDPFIAADSAIYFCYDTISSTLVYDNESIFVCGYLYIDDDVTFNNCEIKFGQLSGIRVLPGASEANPNILTLNGCNLTAGCDYMWDGIFVEAPEAKVIVEGTEIHDALNAVVSRNNGDFEIKGNAGEKSKFYDNFIALKVENYNPTPQVGVTHVHSGEIYNTEIKTVNQLLEPHLNHKAECGIKVSNVNNLIIGDSTQTENIFDNLKTGIRSENSFIQVYNNEFSNIKYKTLPYCSKMFSNPDAAIYATNFNASAYIPKKIIVGGKGTNQENNFSDSNFGVLSKDLQPIVINNSFSTISNAISIYQPKSGVSVQDNTITLNPVSFSEATGIKIQNITPAFGNIDVFENEIYNPKIGIWINQCHAFKSKKIKVAFNYVQFTSFIDKIRYGIRVDGCNGIDVSHNQVTQDYYLDPLGNPMRPTYFFFYKLRGISIAQSQYARVRDNRNILGIGLGIRVAGDCRQTQFTCNYLQNCYNGFYFDTDAYISSQGNSLKKTDNKWLGIYNNDIYSAQYRIGASGDHLLDSLEWYYDSDSSYYDPETQIPTHPLNLFIYPQSTDPSAISSCEWIINSGSIGIEEIIDSLDREEVFGEVIRSDNFYEQLQEAYDFYDNIYLFQYMLDDENFTFLGGTDDDEYQAYFDSLSNTSIGDFAEIDSLISQGNIEEAMDLNETLPEDKEFYLNRKQANRIFFRSFALGDYELSEADSTELMDIAMQLPYPGGDGVYVARAMLGIDPDDYGVSYRKPRPDLDTSTPLSTSVKVYPNPAQNSITVEFIEDTELLNAKIEFFDIVGKKIREINLNGESNIETVSISGLKNGIYFIKISNKNTYIDTFKIIKMQ